MYDITTPSGAKIAEERARETIRELSESVKNRTRAYCKRMNSLYGYPLYVAADVSSGPLKFGAGTIGIPLQICSLAFLLMLPLFAYSASAPAFIAGLHLAIVIAVSLAVHVLLLFASDALCRKYSGKHFGAARGAKLSVFILQDFTLTLAIGLALAGLAAAFFAAGLFDIIAVPT